MLLIICLNVFDVPNELCTTLNLIQISFSLELYFVKLLIGFISKYSDSNVLFRKYVLGIICNYTEVLDTLHQIIDNWTP